MASTRFVILHHRQPDGEHWDLMIERIAALACWQLQREPIAHAPRPIRAVRIGDHRKAYLEYEGPLSGGRGDVTRIEEGLCEILETGASAWRFRLHGRRLVGIFELTCGRSGRWTLRPVTDAP